MHLERFIAQCVAETPLPNWKRDVRKQHIKRAIWSLTRKGLFPAIIHQGKVLPIDPEEVAAVLAQAR
jgi:hypothetical protein